MSGSSNSPALTPLIHELISALVKSSAPRARALLLRTAIVSSSNRAIPRRCRMQC